MEGLQEILSKLAEIHPNSPLNATSKAVLRDRLNEIASQYATPDHPPYSAMIEMALGALKEKRGTSEDSISRFLEKTYSNLPLAHSAFLKHHLAKLCECGDIVATPGKRYMLPTENPTLNLSEVVENNLEPNEEVEHRVCSKHKQVEQGQKKRLLSCDGKDCDSDPTVLPTERRSCHREIGPSETTRGDRCALYTQAQKEMWQAQYDSPKDFSSERPPGFDFNRVKNLSSVNSKATVAQASDEDCVRIWPALRCLRNSSKEFSEPKCTTTTSAKVVASHKSGFFHANLVSSRNQQKIIDLTLPSVEQMPCEKQQSGSLETDVMEVSQSAMANTKLKGDKKYCRRGKRIFEQSESVTTDSCIKLEKPALELPSEIGSPTLNQLLNKQESQDVTQQQEDISVQKQLRRSEMLPKYDIAKYGNDSQPRVPKLKLSEESQESPSLKRKRKQKSVPKDLENWTFVNTKRSQSN